jgi:beta-N-acetylhexosaminidase
MSLRHHAFVAGATIATLIVMAGSGATASAADAPTPGAAGLVTVVAAPEGASHSRAEQTVAAMTLRGKAAAIVMGHIPTTDAAALHAYMESTGIGGFILMGANIPGTEAELRAATAALTVDPALPPLIAVDQEGGDVSRLPWDEFASALTLKDAPAAETTDAFSGRGAIVQRDGIGVNFGIVADVTDDPSMFIYRRALGTTPDAAADRVGAAVAGESGRALSTLKHFPGHGAAPGDSHEAIPSTDLSKDAWAASDAVPFQAGIEAGAELLMFGHLAYTSVDPAPASLSAEWHRIAREELGFDGVTVTDDLGMLEASGIPSYRDPVANAVSALAAGNDLLLTVVGSNAQTAPRIVDGIVAAVESGALPAERLDEAAVRVVALRLALASAGRGLMPCPDCAPVG